MIEELAKQFFESALVDGALPGTDSDTGEPVAVPIAQISIGDVDNKNLDEDREIFPIVLFEEGSSTPKPGLYNPGAPFLSPQYDTQLQISVYDNDKDRADAICYAAQAAVMKGFWQMSLDSDNTKIDAVAWGARLPVIPGAFRNDKENWAASRSITITNRLEP